MNQKGFATIFGLCMILVFALIVRGIQESEANHAREVLNFELEQALQSAAESGIVEATKYVSENPAEFPVYDGWPWTVSKKEIPVKDKVFHNGDKSIDITVEAWGERGKIYFYKNNKKKLKTEQNGVYLMSRATIKNVVLGEEIHRRAYAYILDSDTTKINFMELPTQDGNTITK